MIEMLVRLGLALFISLALALLFAWGWHQSDRHVSQPDRPLAAATPDTQTPLR